MSHRFKALGLLLATSLILSAVPDFAAEPLPQPQNGGSNIPAPDISAEAAKKKPKGNQQDYYIIKMQDALITGRQSDQQDNNSPPQTELPSQAGIQSSQEQSTGQSTGKRQHMPMHAGTVNPGPPGVQEPAVKPQSRMDCEGLPDCGGEFSGIPGKVLQPGNTGNAPNVSGYNLKPASGENLNLPANMLTPASKGVRDSWPSGRLHDDSLEKKHIGQPKYDDVNTPSSVNTPAQFGTSGSPMMNPTVVQPNTLVGPNSGPTMSRYNQTQAVQSNIIKKMDSTQQGIIQNLK